ncbi:MAG: VTT domain-containing protein [Candidatus Aenigmarchaeota archaeon]|nr:VTT domain-containing protein [Candidatus Aenigmarchaeota archaeon]MDI6721926.1 VTT domain-containing protein [Candidatus Aenigmarchaeota archaeon]
MVFSEYLSGLVAWIFVFVKSFGALSVFFVVILEEVFVPIPSPLVIMGSAFILIEPGIPVMEAAGKILLLIVLPASIASTIGSFFTYGIGYYGGKPLVNKFKRFLGMSWGDVQKQEKRLEKGRKVWGTIIIFRAIPFFPISIISVAAGVLRLSWKKYAAATFIGSVPRTFALGFLGWYLGSSYTAVASQFNVIENIIIILIIGLLGFLLYRYRFHAKRIAKRIRDKSSLHYNKIKNGLKK